MNERNVMRLLLAVMIIVGLASRAAPMLDKERLLHQWPTEDGYLMLTIARNIAIGNGMSIGDGEIKTNGTQPLVTLVYAALFKMVGCDKVNAIYLVHIWEILVSLATCYVIFGFARDLLQDTRLANRVPYLAAGLWFVSPVTIRHTMNHLETGTYFLLMTTAVWAWYSRLSDKDKSNDWKSACVIGLLLGISALARIDAVFLIAAVTVWNVLPYLFKNREHFKNRLIQSLIMGSLAVVITSPWLIFNKVNFGSFRPISGVALGEMDRPHRDIPLREANLMKIPVNCLEYFGVILPVPLSIEELPSVQIACRILAVICVIVLLLLAAKANARQRLTMAIPGTVLTCFVLYYGIDFGAPHFIPRYLSPISTFFSISTCVLAVWLCDRIKLPSRIGTALLCGLIAFCAWGHYRAYRGGTTHYHSFVANWAQEHVDGETWVGAIQTGMLGYFHDKTINLDGKVNPFAVQARNENRMIEYIKDSKIEYLVDWNATMLTLHKQLDDDFDVVVDEPQLGANGLGVLKRKSM